jgi:hypothetical protein
MLLAPHDHLDRLINLIKWPSAAASLLIMLPSALTLKDIVKVFWINQQAGLALLAGICLFGLPILMRRQRPGYGFWATFEHEMTHAIFALLSLHSVHSLQATKGTGGLIAYSGRGNWLITISPYFFPTFPLLMGLFALSLPPSFRLLGVGCVGFALAWHVLSTFAETHLQQTDLREVGLLFAFAFLPGISLLSVGFVLTLAHFGGGGPAWYLNSLSQNLLTTVHSYAQWGL